MKEPLRALYEMLDFLASLRETNDIKIWSRLLEKTAAALEAETAVYLFFDSSARQLVPFYRLGSSPGSSEATAIPAGEGLCGWVAKFHEPLLAADTAQDARYRKGLDDQAGSATRSFLCVPLILNLEFVGAFAYFNKAGGPFTPEDLRFADVACKQTAAAIRRLRLEDMVNRVTTYNSSILDNLSGGFLAVDVQGRVMICNPAARRILSLQSEVTDVPVEQALSNIPELASILRRTLSTKQVVKRQDIPWTLAGKKQLLGYSTLIIQDTQGNFTGAGITFQDITALKK